MNKTEPIIKYNKKATKVHCIIISYKAILGGNIFMSKLLLEIVETTDKYDCYKAFHSPY